MEKKLKNIQTFEQHTDKNLNISDVSSSDTITLTKEELETFLQDWSAGFSGEEMYNTWDEKSLRIVKFLGLED